MHTAMPLKGQSLAIFVLAILFMIFAIVAVGLRIWVRVSIIKAFGWDDKLMALATVLYIPLCISFFAGAMNGVGHHLSDFPADMDLYETALFYWWIGEIFYVPCCIFAKLSIAVSLLRLTVTNTHRWIIRSIIILVFISSIYFLFVFVFYCHPVSYYWRRVHTDVQGKCLSPNVIIDSAYFYGAATILSDATLAILPAFLVYNLQMTWRTKIALTLVLGLGALASISVMTRFPYLHHYKDEDFLYTTLPIGLCTITECGAGVIAGSLFTLRPLFRWFLDKSKVYSSEPAYKYGTGPGNYALSGMRRKDNISNIESGWRTVQDDKDQHVVTTVTSKPPAALLGQNNSQEYLNPVDMSANHVNIQETFVVTREPWHGK